jgi:dissimilatory sulfite reductase (desulfoviridin) alpha/beta subunit
MKIFKYPGFRMRKPAKTFKDLIVWQRAHQLVEEVSNLLEAYRNSILDSES